MNARTVTMVKAGASMGKVTSRNARHRLAPSTLAACGEESLGEEYVQLLGDVKTYSVAENQMTLTLENSSELLFQTRT